MQYRYDTSIVKSTVAGGLRLSLFCFCSPLLAELLRVPCGLTVPILKIDPAWDPVRNDPGFKALLADPKNLAPL
jgi:hypothetical protein